MHIIDYMKLALQVKRDPNTGKETARNLGYLYRCINIETGESKKKFIHQDGYSDRLFREYVVNGVVFV
jgi:tRNA G26 N,N-dimethylase Trm1